GAGRAGTAKAAQVVADNREICCQRLELRPPHAHVEREAVDEDKRAAFARDLEGELAIVDGALAGANAHAGFPKLVGNGLIALLTKTASISRTANCQRPSGLRR